jgi:hypothetical protein
MTLSPQTANHDPQPAAIMQWMLVTLGPTSYSPHMTRPTALCAETADTRHAFGIHACSRRAVSAKG